MKRYYLYNVTFKDIISEKERTPIIEATSMLNAVLKTDLRLSQSTFQMTKSV